MSWLARLPLRRTDQSPSLGFLVSHHSFSPCSVSAPELILAYADAACDPMDFPTAPTLAVPKVLDAAGLTKDDIELWEFNEAFSVVVRIVEKTLGIDPAKINVNGYVLV